LQRGKKISHAFSPITPWLKAPASLRPLFQQNHITHDKPEQNGTDGQQAMEKGELFLFQHARDKFFVSPK